MADDEATTFTFGEFLILIGDGNSPEIFEDWCGVTSRGFERTANMNDTNVPRCTTPDDPSWLQRDVVSLSVSMPFAGVVASESLLKFDNFFEQGASKNVRVELGNIAAWEGRAKMANFNITGQRGNRATFTASLVSDGVFLRATT